jgi:uroporphyrinogen decarboxylase
MITSHERITAALEHRTLDRVPLCETGFWPEALRRWEGEGLPKGADPHAFFGLDRIHSPHPFDCGFFDYVIYEDDGAYITDLNGQGAVVKYAKVRDSSAGHMELDHKVKTIEDWREARRRLIVTETRFGEVAPAPPGDFHVISAIDHFWMSFKMCGMENLCCWLVQAPEEMREIYDDYVTFLIGMLDLSLKRLPPFEGLWFFSDMAFHSGPMFSPRTYRDTIAPGYARLRTWCDRHDKWMLLHTDGNLDALTPELIRSGFDWLHPLEARAGNDVRQMKPRYGDQVTLVGNINMDVLARGNKDEIEQEVAPKVEAAKINGGYVFNSDHSVPPTIAFESYAFTLEVAKKHGRY